jgi:hypothetical protein
VNLTQDAKRKTLRLASAALILCLAAGAGYRILRTAPAYLESATLVFQLPKARTSPNAYVIFAPSLITSSEAMTQILLSPQAQQQIRQVARTADVDVQLVNLYSEQYPDYGEPLATLTATSPSAATTHRAFTSATRLVSQLLAARQAKASVPRRDRIAARIIADSGTVAQRGSAKRVIAGLALLALVGVAAVWGFIDRAGLSARADR